MADVIGEYQGGRIVVGVNGSEPSKDALRWAIGEAERSGSSVKAIMAWEEPTAAYGFGMPIPTDFDVDHNYERALHGVVRGHQRTRRRRRLSCRNRRRRGKGSGGSGRGR